MVSVATDLKNDSRGFRLGLNKLLLFSIAMTFTSFIIHTVLHLNDACGYQVTNNISTPRTSQVATVDSTDDDVTVQNTMMYIELVLAETISRIP